MELLFKNINYTVKSCCRKGGRTMKKIRENVSKVICDAALLVAKANVNSTCFFHAHQPKLPTGAEKLKK